MIKTIKISEEKDLKLDSSQAWTIIFEAQFQHDILPDLLPLLNAAIDVSLELYRATGGKISNPIEILDKMDPENIKDALLDLAALQYTDLQRIIWALAKNADDNVEEPLRFFKGFDVFPWDVVLPELFELLIRSTVSAKNSERILNLLARKDPD